MRMFCSRLHQGVYLTMRLDKFVADTCICTRKQADAIIRKGRITVDGVVVKKGDFKVNEKSAHITFDNNVIEHREFIYLIMNKPPDVVSATDDPRDITVLSLLPENYQNKGLFPVGRLDKDTVGLLVLTNDGKNAHRLLSPRHHVEKEYYVECDQEFREEDIAICAKGIMMDGELTKPCVLKIDPENKKCAKMVLTEGKYHEIKRICAHLGKKVTFLERIRFGNLLLDPGLSRSQWREMTEYEISLMG